jgi:hypothetical protein
MFVFKYYIYFKFIKEKRREKGHAKCVKILIEYGADITACDNEGAQPIHYAAYFRMNSCIDAFKNTTYSALDSKGNSPFHYGCFPLPQAYISSYLMDKYRKKKKPKHVSGKAATYKNRSESPERAETLVPGLSLEGKPLHLIALLKGVKCTCYLSRFDESNLPPCKSLLCARNHKVFYFIHLLLLFILGTSTFAFSGFIFSWRILCCFNHCGSFYYFTNIWFTKQISVCATFINFLNFISSRTNIIHIDSFISFV